jgi:hypothetical protein
MALTDDERRQVRKALDVMGKVQEHFDHEAAMNAALHMSDVVRPAPLAAAVSASVMDLARLLGEEGHPDD